LDPSVITTSSSLSKPSSASRRYVDGEPNGELEGSGELGGNGEDMALVAGERGELGGKGELVGIGESPLQEVAVVCRVGVECDAVLREAADAENLELLGMVLASAYGLFLRAAVKDWEKAR
jgi:hypothetical protein